VYGSCTYNSCSRLSRTNHDERQNTIKFIAIVAIIFTKIRCLSADNIRNEYSKRGSAPRTRASIRGAQHVFSKVSNGNHVTRTCVANCTMVGTNVSSYLNEIWFRRNRFALNSPTENV